MKQKKIPLRKCTGCNEMKPKKELIRIVRSPEVKNENGEVIQEPQISLDTTGKKSGRGAYVCNNIECLQKAQKARRLERAFSCKIPEEVYTQLEEGMKSLEQ
ncbi:MAG: YlxR family protein [Acutalibacteraceae bacterium]|nr:YlxR family protein [Acutalibacteraceae bacterium]